MVYSGHLVNFVEEKDVGRKYLVPHFGLDFIPEFLCAAKGEVPEHSIAPSTSLVQGDYILAAGKGILIEAIQAWRGFEEPSRTGVDSVVQEILNFALVQSRKDVRGEGQRVVFSVV